MSGIEYEGFSMDSVAAFRMRDATDRVLLLSVKQMDAGD